MSIVVVSFINRYETVWMIFRKSGSITHEIWAAAGSKDTLLMC